EVGVRHLPRAAVVALAVALLDDDPDSRFVAHFDIALRHTSASCSPLGRLSLKTTCRATSTATRGGAPRENATSPFLMQRRNRLDCPACVSRFDASGCT